MAPKINASGSYSEKSFHKFGDPGFAIPVTAIAASNGG